MCNADMQASIKRCRCRLWAERARGAFAGISLEGSTLRPDDGANRNLYGRSVSARDIVRGSEVPTPEAAQGLIALLDHASPKLNRS